MPDLLNAAITSAPTLQLFINGPSASITVNDFSLVEPTIQALCFATGDDDEDYTCTNLDDARRIEHIEQMLKHAKEQLENL